MKNKTILLLILICLTCKLALAQDNKFDTGINGSAGFITLWDGKLFPRETKAGFACGFSFQYNLSPKLSVHTELSYDRKGAVDYFPVTDINANPIGEMAAYTNLDYLTLPILLRAYFGSKIRFFINGGPYFGYLARYIVVNELKNREVSSNDYTSRSNKRLDIGLSLGYGIQFPFRQQFAISVELRDNLGLSGINGFDEKTNSLNLMLGFIFHLKNSSKG